MKRLDQYKGLSIKQRFTIPVLFAVIFIESLVGAVWMLSANRANEADLKLKVTTTTELASISLSNPLWSFNDVGIDSIIRGLFKDNEIGMVSVDSNYGINLITHKKEGLFYDQMVYETLPITHENTVIGDVTVGITPYFRMQALHKEFMLFAEGLLCMIAFIWLTIAAVSKAITRPISDLIVETEEIVAGNLATRLKTEVGGELGQLAEKFNIMSEHLQSSIQESERFLLSLTASEEKFNKAFRYVADPIGIINLSSRCYIDINEAFVKTLGYDRDMVIGHSSTEFGLWFSTEQREAVYRQLLTVGSFKNLETHWKTASDEIRIGLSSAEVIEINEEKCVLFVWIDITERIKLEEMLKNINDELEEKVEQRTGELSAANDQLTGLYNELQFAQNRILQQEKMASIGQLAAGIAHEINNPLGFIICNIECLNDYSNKIFEFISKQQTALDGLVQLTQDKSDSESAIQIVSEVENSKATSSIAYIKDDIPDLLASTIDGANRIKVIIQDLKTFARTVAEVTETDINKNIQSVINILMNEIKYRIKLEKDFGVLPLIWCNSDQISQVFMNILHNAIQAIENEGTIGIRSWAEDEYVHVSISDTGPGITEDVQKRMFDPFFTTKAIGVGTGLGLSIAFEIINKHNGSIEVDSSIGQGTIFHIKMPILAQR